VAKKMAIAAFDRGIRYFTIFGFSTENWQRAQEEVGYLMDLWYGLLINEFGDLEKRGVRFRLLGSRDGLSKRLVKAIDDTEERTRGNKHGTLGLCLNYGGRAELADAYRSLMRAGVTADQVDPGMIEKHLYASDIPPVDMVVRTSGEQRVSGFMLWRIAYAELYFVKKHWPDFTVEELDAALAEYTNRHRRFGN
jgi:undecaprenyl diphosphate synthase